MYRRIKINNAVLLNIEGYFSSFGLDSHGQIANISLNLEDGPFFFFHTLIHKQNRMKIKSKQIKTNRIKKWSP